jgi:hypothetical protein
MMANGESLRLTPTEISDLIDTVQKNDRLLIELMSKRQAAERISKVDSRAVTDGMDANPAKGRRL